MPISQFEHGSAIPDIGADVDFSGPALDAIKSMGSDFLIEHEADAVVTSRARVYGLLQKADAIRPGETVLSRNGTWAVVRVARHASIEDKSQFAETLLICIQKGTEEAAPVRQRVRLMSAEEAVRERKHITDEVVEEGRTIFRWDNKRRLKDRDTNIFTSWTDTQPYASSESWEQTTSARCGPGRPAGSTGRLISSGGNRPRSSWPRAPECEVSPRAPASPRAPWRTSSASS